MTVFLFLVCCALNLTAYGLMVHRLYQDNKLIARMRAERDDARLMLFEQQRAQEEIEATRLMLTDATRLH